MSVNETLLLILIYTSVIGTFAGMLGLVHPKLAFQSSRLSAFKRVILPSFAVLVVSVIISPDKSNMKIEDPLSGEKGDFKKIPDNENSSILAGLFKSEPISSENFKVYPDQKITWVAGKILEEFWEEARSNNNLEKYVANVQWPTEDKYGKRLTISLGSIEFTASEINEIRKYSSFRPLWKSSNEMNRLVQSDLVVLMSGNSDGGPGVLSYE